MSKIETKDDLVPEIVFKEMCDHLTGDSFAWYMGKIIREDEQLEDEELTCSIVDNLHFCHIFYEKDRPNSKDINWMDPILCKLDHKSLIRIKANCTVRTSTIVSHGYHIDIPFKESKTSIYYLNSNDGYTEFEDGTKIESVANRLVTFPSTMRHSGTSCTNERNIIVINFNYF